MAEPRKADTRDSSPTDRRGSTEPDAFEFAGSSLLPERADALYEWFLKALAVPGDVAECGVSAGETSCELARYLETMGIQKRVHMFDTFEGLPETFSDEDRGQSCESALKAGKYACTETAVIERMGPLRRYVVHRGLFCETFPQFDQDLCFIHADADLYTSTVDIIRLADRCLVPGGIIVFDDYENPVFPGVTVAIARMLDPKRFVITGAPERLQCYALKR